MLRARLGPEASIQTIAYAEQRDINGVRLGMGVAMIGTLLAETKLSNKGVGFMIIDAYNTFDMPRMYAVLLTLFVIAIGANTLVGRASRGSRSGRSPRL